MISDLADGTPATNTSFGSRNSQLQGLDLLPCIRQRCVDIEHAGSEHILLSAAPSQMEACLERWMYPRRDEYRPQWWYDVVAVIFPPSRLSLLAEGWTSSTGESTTEAPSVTTHAESPLTSHTIVVPSFYILESLLPVFTTGGTSSSTKLSNQTHIGMCTVSVSRWLRTVDTDTSPHRNGGGPFNGIESFTVVVKLSVYGQRYGHGTDLASAVPYRGQILCTVYGRIVTVLSVTDPCSSPFGPGHLFNAVHNPPVVRYLVKKSVPVLGYDDGSPATSALKSREGYRHVAPRNPTSDNASRIRMWTVSSSHPAPNRSFSLTMHEMTGGAAAPARSEVGATVFLEYDGSDDVVKNALDGSPQDQAKFCYYAQ
ncbi:hypothetical protein ARMGADRAFT_1067135 [Armillaria gallica]|uniref:Uncharacterized protein n=1 Tax=Armillaria gallica TaxID=47427 RepID=A0A2H3D2I5_ARMGA|nr:hypothetical protein ARMGADRAFT_1067135 [Armillaria gallica]